MTIIRAWGKTDVGNIKDHNEDYYVVDDEHRLFVVADGVSGRTAGEVASKELVGYIQRRGEELRELIDGGDPLNDEAHRELILQRVVQIIQGGNTEVYELGKQPGYGGGMATTVVMLALGDSVGFVGHVGDSRVYLKRQDRIFRITEDHTYAEMLRKQEAEGVALPPGLKDRFEHVLTRSIGHKPHVDVDVAFFELQPGDQFLLCSDGLTDYLTGAELSDHLQRMRGDQLLTVLIDEALERGGHDNITVVQVEVHDQGKALATTQRMDTLKKMNFLGEMALFQDLSRVELLRSLRVIYEHTYAPGEVVVRRGERADSIYIIAEGECVVERHGAELTTLVPGENFGELSMLDDSVSSVDVICKKDSILMAIPLTNFQQLIRDDLEIGNKLMWNMLRQMGRNIERMNDLAADVLVGEEE